MNAGRELDAVEKDPPSWIKDKMTLLVRNGKHGMEYSAVAESDPYLVENVGWLVDIRYTLSGQRDTVDCAKCINPTNERSSFPRAQEETNHSKGNKPKAKSKRKKGRGGNSRQSRPPSVTSINDSDMLSLKTTSSLTSFSVLSEPENNVARLPSPEECRRTRKKRLC